MPRRLFIIIAAILSATVYLFINYWTERHEFALLFGGMSILFLFYFVSALVPSLRPGRRDVFWLSLIFRGLLLFSLPVLSDDFYRFYLDGILTLNGTDPFAFRPSEIDLSLLPEGEYIQQSIYPKLNSKEYYSVYPPILQYIFAFGALISSNVEGFCLVLKTLLFFSDFALLAVFYRLTQLTGVRSQQVGLYMLNPLVIMETANLHFESLAVLAIALCWLFYLEGKKWISGSLGVLAFYIKLLPILIVPFLLKKSGVRNQGWFMFGFIGVGILFLSPFYSQHFFTHFSESITLYFKTFEFNGGLYYLIRELGYALTGYNIIHVVGNITPYLILLCIVFIWWKFDYKQLPVALLLTYTVYYIPASIVHPWYLIPLLFFATFTGFRYIWIWSFLIFLSYSAYKMGGKVQENTLLIAFEYLVVWGVFLYELLRKKLRCGAKSAISPI